MKSKDDLEDVRINFNDNQIYMDKFKNSNDFAGYILLLKHIKGYTLSVEDETIHILIVDKNNHERDMYLKIKNEKTDKEKAQEEKEKKEKEAKKKQKVINIKELRLTPNIEDHDLNTKANRAIDFLKNGDRVKVSVRFRGREMGHTDLGRDVLDKFYDLISEYGVVDKKPKMEGRSLVMFLSERKDKDKSDN